MNEKLEAILDSGFEYKGRTYSALTAMGLVLLERVDSSFYNGEDESITAVLDYLFVTDSSNDVKELIKLSRNKEAWEDAVLEYSANFGAGELKEVSRLVAESARKLSATMVEVEEDADEGK